MLVSCGHEVIIVSSAAVRSGIPTVVASGRKAGEIVRAASGKPAGTYFPPLIPLQAQ